MSGFILGEKSKQLQHFTPEGDRIPTTFIKTSPLFLVSIKLEETHGYCSIKLGFGNKKNIQKPVLGELKKAGIKVPLHFLHEFRLSASELESLKLTVGQEIKPADFFKVGEKLKIIGVSKGKGFQGVVKRHGFKGGPHTHGQSHGERAPGAIGSTTTPGRVNKGKRMAGRMGGERIAIKNLQIIEIKDDGILVKGLVPGFKGGLLEVVTSK